MRISDWSSYECASDLLGRGSTSRIAGLFGDGFMLQSRFERVNMALLNAIYPDMGLGGRATGSLDFEQAGAAAFPRADARLTIRSEEHTSELQSLMRTSYAVFCLKKKTYRHTIAQSCLSSHTHYRSSP